MPDPSATCTQSPRLASSRAFSSMSIASMQGIVAKSCDVRKQHFASQNSHDGAMEKRPINHVLADALNFFMSDYWSNLSLARASGVAESTIRNYRTPDKRDQGKSGKPSSAKLTEVELIAVAMGLEVADLLKDTTEEERARLYRQRAAEHYQRTGSLPAWAPKSETPKADVLPPASGGRDELWGRIDSAVKGARKRGGRKASR